MWFSCLLATSMMSLAIAAGNEYLPPKNGYHYDAPPIEFTTPNRVPRPTPPIPTYRPTPPIPTYRPAPPTRPPYLPPPTPGPRPPQPPPNPPHPPTPHHDDHDHSHDHDHHHHEPGMPFDFAYAVNEDGNDYSHNAVSDGDVTRGEYRVALPDGRTQIVKYTADWKNGFNAEVTYEGQARYPDQPINGYGNGNTGGQSYVPPNQGGGYQY